MLRHITTGAKQRETVMKQRLEKCNLQCRENVLKRDERRGTLEKVKVVKIKVMINLIL